MALGGSIGDAATLSGGGLGAAAASGVITFNLFGPKDATCAGASIFTSLPAISGNGPYSSATFIPVAAGTYRWIASYAGDPNNLATANVCNAANEFVNVTAAGASGSIGSPGPSLSEWAMLMLAVVLAFVGFKSLRKQQI